MCFSILTTLALLLFLIMPAIAVHDLCQMHNSDHDWSPYSGYRIFNVYDATTEAPALNRWRNHQFRDIGTSVTGSAALRLLMKINAANNNAFFSTTNPRQLIVKCRFGKSEKWSALPVRSSSESQRFPLEACLAGPRFTTDDHPHDVVCVKLTIASKTATTSKSAATTPSFQFKTLTLTELNNTATLPAPDSLPLLKSGQWPFIHIGPETSHVPQLMIPIMFTPGVLNRRYRLNSHHPPSEVPTEYGQS